MEINKDKAMSEPIEEIKRLMSNLSYSDIFVSVRQRVAAYKLYRKFWTELGDEPYGVQDENDYLDEAYRFLNKRVDPEFVLFCAKAEEEEPIEYAKGLIENT